jgi:hypothetical protein
MPKVKSVPAFGWTREPGIASLLAPCGSIKDTLVARASHCPAPLSTIPEINFENHSIHSEVFFDVSRGERIQRNRLKPVPGQRRCVALVVNGFQWRRASAVGEISPKFELSSRLNWLITIAIPTEGARA